ncbi:hypothetical protein L6164_031691 [Bauhinia variegata]|uniref:Uncharacterized protein n=1 Tax=Bauhinia variegata TaxID=167791 RepID=A0ACB9LG81_BAUVA|nr:hypothetical protein L6164_031691 [Bauhinia variegata]
MMSLEELIIRGCSSLKEVFGIPCGEDGQAIKLPALKKVKGCPQFRGPVDYFQNLSQGQNPELDSESEEEDVIWQNIALSQEGSEVHNAQTGTSNIINTASSSVEVDADQSSSTNISQEQRDVTQTSSAPVRTLNQECQTPEFHNTQDGTQYIDDGPLSAIKASCSSEATAVQSSSSNVTKKDKAFTPQTSRTEDANLKEMGSISNLHGENFENAEGHSETTKESVHEQVPISGKHSVATSLLGGKDFDSQTETKQDVNLNAPLEPTNSEYQNPEVGANQKKMNAMEQSTTQAGIPLLGTAPSVSPGNLPTGLDLHKATETIIINILKLLEDYSYKGPRKEDKHEHPPDNVNIGAASSGRILESNTGIALFSTVAQNADITTPVPSVSLPPIHALPIEVDSMMRSSSKEPALTREEEYAPFRDIVSIKKKHIPLLEQAIASYPSLWAWHEESMHPKTKQFGYTLLGDMLEFLASTKWRDLNEQKKVEFESLLDGLERFGFDTQWLANTCAQIKKRKTINRMKMLQQQAMALESELDGIRVELETFNNFIGF